MRPQGRLGKIFKSEIGNHEASIQLQILVKDENVGLVTIAFLALSFVISKDLDIKLVSLTQIRKGFR